MAMPSEHEPLDPSVTQQEQNVGLRGPVARQGLASGPHRPGLAFLGLLIVLLGAWGGIVPYVGPTFGYRATRSGSFVWTASHALLYLLPGALALAMGLIILGALLGRDRGATVAKGMAALLVMVCGAWFVLGPAVWPIFSSSVVFGPATGALARFTNYLGYNLGTGLLLTALGAVLFVRPATDGYLIYPGTARPTTIPPS